MSDDTKDRRKRWSMSKEMTVGAVFFTIVTILLIFTAVLARISWGTSPFWVEFDRIASLDSGNDVRLAGVDIGTVKGMRFTNNGKVLVELSIKKTISGQKIRIYQGAKFVIKPFSPLGGYYMAIEDNHPTVTIDGEQKKNNEITENYLNWETPFRDPNWDKPDVSSHKVAVELGPMEMISKLVDEENESNFKATLKNLAEATSAIAKPKEGDKPGLMARALHDEKLGESFGDTLESLNETLGDVKKITSQVAAGKGSLGKLVMEEKPEVYNNLNGALANLRSILAKVDRGKGPASLLINDAQTAAELKQAVRDLRHIVHKVNKPGTGTISMLINDPEAGRNIANTVAHIEVLTRSVKEGRGSIGKLWMDPALYNEAKYMISELRESMEDLREQAPINAFVGAVFAAF